MGTHVQLKVRDGRAVSVLTEVHGQFGQACRAPQLFPGDTTGAGEDRQNPPPSDKEKEYIITVSIITWSFALEWT